MTAGRHGLTFWLAAEADVAPSISAQAAALTAATALLKHLPMRGPCLCAVPSSETITGRGGMTHDLQFGWELSGSGWATCLIKDGSSERKDIVSYCTDALADLLHGVAGLYGPLPVQRFSFDLEPAEVRWVLRGRGSEVDVAIHRFPDMSASLDAPDQKGTLVWASTQPRDLLGHVVLEAAQSVLQAHGEDGYRAKWVRHSFPIAALQDLRRLHLQHDRCELRHGVATPQAAG